MISLIEALNALNAANDLRCAPLPSDLTGKKRRKVRSRRNAKYNAARAVVDGILDNVDIDSATDLERQLLTERQDTHNRAQDKTDKYIEWLNRSAIESAKFVREYRREQDKLASPYKDTLKQAARIARSLGFTVKSSKYNGLVSSYYIESTDHEVIAKYGDNYKMRLSDHDLPINHKRDCGYVGKELIIDMEATNAQLKIAIEGIWTGVLPNSNLSEIIQ